METLHLILESNIINFILFIAFIAWLLNRLLGKAIQQKNESLIEELKKAQEKCLSSEKQLALAEEELMVFKNNLQKIKEESEIRLKALKEELKSEKEKKIEFLKIKTEREIENMRLNLQNEIEEKIASRALDLAEQLMKNDLNSNSSNFQKIIIKNTLNLIENNPILLQH